MNLNYFISLFCVALGLAYLFIRRSYSYWERFGIPFIEPKFPFGNIKGIGQTIHMSTLFQKFYDELKGRGQFGGLYFFTKPTVLATNLDFVKNVLVKDFNYFVSRGLYYNEKDDPLSAHLIAVDGDKWKKLRSKLTPTLSSGKMKYMFPTIISVAEEFERTISDAINENNSKLEVKDILARYTTDIIGNCAFGIDCNSLKNPNNEFRKYGREVFDKPRNSFIKRLFLNSFRDLGRKMKMKMVADDVAEFFLNSLKDTIRYREENNVQRNDFLNMMMELQKYGKLLGDSEIAVNAGEGKLSFNEAAAQCFVFFMAGFETSSTTLTYCLFELSVNPDIQSKARQEVVNVLRKYNGEFTYEAMMEMHYLDYCIRESLRKYPPLATVFRQCTKDYHVPNTKFTITKGTNVLIPVFSFHHDPEIYFNPDVYDPNRFTPDEVQKRHPLSFLPFGEGPRNCIALRFGYMQAIIGLATFLKNFEFFPHSTLTNPLPMDPKALSLFLFTFKRRSQIKICKKKI